MSDQVLLEPGIGATRALVIANGVVVAAHVERPGARAGSRWIGRLSRILEPVRRGIVDLGGEEGLLEPLPALAEGGLIAVEVVREALPEAGRPRLAKLRACDAPGRAPGLVSPGPDLAARLAAAGHRPMTVGGPGEDRLEAAGWTETVEAARTGHVGFPGGLLTISPTPAMTVIDIDGAGAPLALAEAAAAAVAAAIARFDITGSIGVDFPSLTGKTARVGIDTLLDRLLPRPFEKTAINGFGFVQIVRPRLRASFLEQVRAPGYPALELLRRAARGAPGPRTLVAHPATIAWLEARPALLAELARRQGGAVALRADAAMAILGGDVVL